MMDKKYYYDEHLAEVFLEKFHLNKITEFLRDSERILDFGCGNAWFAERFLSKFPKKTVFNVDKSQYVIEKNKSRGISNCFVGSFDDLPILFDTKRVNSMDAIVCFDVLEHLFDVDTVMYHFKQLLRDNGKIIIKVATIRDLDWFFSDYTHVRPFTEYSTELLLKNHGFKVREVEECWINFKGKRILDSYIGYGIKGGKTK